MDKSLAHTFAITSDAAANAKNIRDFNIDDIELDGWSGQWKGRFFTDMWELREELDYIGYRLDHNHATVRRIAEKNVNPNDQDDLWE